MQLSWPDMCVIMSVNRQSKCAVPEEDERLSRERRV